MKQIQVQIDDVTPQLIRDAVRDGDRVIVFEDGEPLALVTGSAAELGRHKDFFVHYPHEAAECFNTCFRHDPKIQAAAAAEAEAEAAQLVGAGTGK